MSKLLEYYEYLHAHPELSKQEFQTAEFLMETLSGMGYSPVRIGTTGVYADLIVDENLPFVMLRSDMDALPVNEETGISYASQNPGVMHACGHDSHMAMLLSAAEELKEKRLPQNIRFLFQPAEEGVTGAQEMVEAGAVPKNTAAVFGMHVWPGVPKGKVLAKTGQSRPLDGFSHHHPDPLPWIGCPLRHPGAGQRCADDHGTNSCAVERGRGAGRR